MGFKNSRMLITINSDPGTDSRLNSSIVFSWGPRIKPAKNKQTQTNKQTNKQRIMRRTRAKPHTRETIEIRELHIEIGNLKHAGDVSTVTPLQVDGALL